MAVDCKLSLGQKVYRIGNTCRSLESREVEVICASSVGVIYDIRDKSTNLMETIEESNIGVDWFESIEDKPLPTEGIVIRNLLSKNIGVPLYDGWTKKWCFILKYDAENEIVTYLTSDGIRYEVSLSGYRKYWALYDREIDLTTI